MREVRRSARLACSADQVFAVVADVAAYPEFVSWCEEAAADTANQQQTATLGIRQGAFHGVFRTRNCLRPSKEITMQLLEGPLQHLSGRWSFEEQQDGSCQVSLDVRFQFGSIAKDFLFGKIFETICGQLLDAVVARAETLAE